MRQAEGGIIPKLRMLGLQFEQVGIPVLAHVGLQSLLVRIGQGLNCIGTFS